MPSPEDYDRCRTLRHHLDILDVSHVDDPLGEVMFCARFRCTYCTTLRTDEYDADGDLVRREYKHPPGYLLGKDDVRPELRDLRLRLLNRHLTPVTPLEMKES